MNIKDAIKHFTDFHTGTLNIILHILGFAGIFYSIYRSDWILFAAFLIILESGHIYNHLTGIKKYESSLKVNVWRTIVFFGLVAAFYFIILLFSS